jgi:hypothetical protein
MIAPMKAATNLLILLTTAFAVAQATEKYDLTWKPKEGDTKKYVVRLTMNESPKIEVSGTLTSKVLKSTGGGKNEVEISCTDFKALMDGQPTNEFEPQPTTVFKLGRNGLGESMTVQGSQILSTVLLFSSYLPEKPVGVGETFKVAWQSKGGNGSMDGEGKFESIEEKDGKKIALLKWKASVQPDDVDGAAELVLESRFELASWTLISTKATGNTPGGEISFSLTPAK